MTWLDEAEAATLFARVASGEAWPRLPRTTYLALAWSSRTATLRQVGQGGDLAAAVRALAMSAAASKSLPKGVGQAALTGDATARVTALGALLARLPMEVFRDGPEATPYFVGFGRAFPRTAWVIGWSAAPPLHDIAFAIVARQPVGTAGDGERALIAAIAAGDRDRAAALIDGGGLDLDGCDDDGASALHHAVARRDDELVARLLAAGASPDAGAAYGNPAGFAVRGADGAIAPLAAGLDDGAHLAIVLRLLDAGGSPAVEAGGRGLLELVAAAPQLDAAAVAALVARGVKPFAFRRSQTALHAAIHAFQDRYEGEPTRAAVPALIAIAAGADVNQVARDGTPLATLLGRGYPRDRRYLGEVRRIVEALLAAGAAELPDRWGELPGDHAVTWDDPEAPVLLPLFTRFSGGAVGRAVHAGSLALLRHLLDRGAPADEPSLLDGNTALHQAASQGAGALAHALVDAGADLERLSRERRSPARPPLRADELAAAAGHAVLAAELAARRRAPGRG